MPGADASHHLGGLELRQLYPGLSAAPLLERHAAPVVAGSGTAIQRQEGKDVANPAQPSAASEPQVDPPVAGDSKPGFIDHSDGANIRTRPAELAGSQTLTDAPLPLATRVFVSDSHPQTAEWLYATAFLPGSIVRGYVP